jgi:putative transcriptional regulator
LVNKALYVSIAPITISRVARVYAAALLISASAVWAAELAPGKLLVATSESRDPDFARSVVLLIHYDRRGAVGVMLNRPSRIPISDLLPDAKGLGGFAWAGGPVAMGVLAVAELDKAPALGVRLFENVYAITDRAGIGRALRSRARIRVFAGNCGWTVDQLAGEIERRLWRIRPCTAALIFDADPATLWERLSR